MKTSHAILLLGMLASRAFAGDDTRVPKIDALFAATEANVPGYAVLVVQNGRTVFERGYGVADLRTRKKIDAATDFRLASVSKQFTASAIMLLVRDGKLHYDDRLTDVLPGFA